MSKHTVVSASSVSPGPKPGSRAIDDKKLVSARWGTRTPLGRPVEPEV
ncbi:hypothetical protein ENSA7_66340 [Enhygromyxa salina]|uniref:Uncharacterized protein n=1 Tax=Enhygromyxa salina TaxID=215803 RepID=A0A2S9XYI7_9BACT|nr:hypothetical protein ENSA7_66340 [Enhygromyxa salina]